MTRRPPRIVRDNPLIKKELLLKLPPVDHLQDQFKYLKSQVQSFYDKDEDPPMYVVQNGVRMFVAALKMSEEAVRWTYKTPGEKAYRRNALLLCSEIMKYCEAEAIDWMSYQQDKDHPLWKEIKMPELKG